MDLSRELGGSRVQKNRIKVISLDPMLFAMVLGSMHTGLKKCQFPWQKKNFHIERFYLTGVWIRFFVLPENSSHKQKPEGFSFLPLNAELKMLF